MAFLNLDGSRTAVDIDLEAARPLQDDPEQERKRIKNDGLRSTIALRGKYAHWFFWLPLGQLVALNAIFVVHRLGWLRFDDWEFNIYVGGTLLETFGVILVVARGLFHSA